MLDTLTTEELLRHCIQHGPMTEMERVLFERLEEVIKIADSYGARHPDNGRTATALHPARTHD